MTIEITDLAFIFKCKELKGYKKCFLRGTGLVSLQTESTEIMTTFAGGSLNTSTYHSYSLGPSV